MKNQIFLSIALTTLLFFLPSGTLHAFDSLGVGHPFSDNRAPSDAAYERITNFDIGSPVSPFAAPPPTGGGGVTTDPNGGSEDATNNINDIPIGSGGIFILLGIALMHGLSVMMRKRVINERKRISV